MSKRVIIRWAVLAALVAAWVLCVRHRMAVREEAERRAAYDDRFRERWHEGLDAAAEIGK